MLQKWSREIKTGFDFKTLKTKRFPQKREKNGYVSDCSIRLSHPPSFTITSEKKILMPQQFQVIFKLKRKKIKNM